MCEATEENVEAVLSASVATLALTDQQKNDGTLSPLMRSLRLTPLATMAAIVHEHGADAGTYVDTPGRV